jgi:hypothetical protein
MSTPPQGGANQRRTSTPPNPLQLLLHVGKTARLAGALLRDVRVSVFRKIFFLSAIAALIGLLFATDAVTVVVESAIPLFGPLVGLPADAAFDWVAVAVIAFNLLRVFPAQIVGEHYDRLFHGRTLPKPSPKVIDAPAQHRS